MKEIFKAAWAFIYLLIFYVITYLLLVFINTLVNVFKDEEWYSQRTEVLYGKLYYIKRKMRNLFGK